ncbi:putative integral membrane protein [Candida albicans]|uniref:Putative integral membrane protein n=1 Tax=Candida albicans TaxID=5476 RepID=A0A8H6C1K2_CANAX|nr:putative integral membrane protein [Candida albicans]
MSTTDNIKLTILSHKSEQDLIQDYGSRDNLAVLEEQTLRVIDSNELAEAETKTKISIFTKQPSYLYSLSYYGFRPTWLLMLPCRILGGITNYIVVNIVFFTLIIGYLVSIEKINQNKILGILLSFAGVLIVTKADATEDNPNTDNSALLILWGNILALLGALIYGIYTILLKFKITIPHSKKKRI